MKLPLPEPTVNRAWNASFCAMTTSPLHESLITIEVAAKSVGEVGERQDEHQRVVPKEQVDHQRLVREEHQVVRVLEKAGAAGYTPW